MPPAGAVVLGSDSDVVEVGIAALARGNAVDAVVSGVFAATGLYPSVLLGPVQILIGGAGAGLRAIDGRLRQPGLGNPRPRGFLASEVIPDAARVAVPTLPAALLAATTTYGKLSVAAAVGPGLELARGRSKERAAVLQRIGQRGPAALADDVIADELTALTGRLAGGLLTKRDLDEVRPVVTSASVHSAGEGREVMTVPWGGTAVRESGAPCVFGADVRVIVAVDRNGLVAVACYEVPSEGLRLDVFELVAPFKASPVLRGEPRVKPGEPRSAAAPIALGRSSGVLDLVIGIGTAAEAEGLLGAWLAGYRPASELEREGALPPGLAAAQRAGSTWAAVS